MVEASVPEIIDELRRKIGLLKGKVEKLESEKLTLLQDKLDYVKKTEEQEREINELRSLSSNFNVASAIAMKQTQAEDAKKVIAALIQEIDKCIALLNA